jgi:SNF2 family DNA or RNA helicase|tara:strand:- start:345 stop:1793 length:1449 start_codon:yes stop_codon:yes gene_type:complete
MAIQDYTHKTEPYQHQTDSLLESWDKTNWAYLMEMGTGKSKVCIDNAAILFEAGEIDTFVIVAPKGVYRNWAHLEIPAHMPDRLERTVVIWRSGANKSEKALLMGLLEPSKGLRILAMNVEALSTPKGRKYLTALLSASKALLAVDESTAIKSPKAARTKALIKLGELATYRRILTGFPVTQSPMDLWAQCRFLDKELLGDCGDNFFQFQYRYAVMKKQHVGSHSFNRVVGYRNLEQLGTILKEFSSRITKDECLDLPAKIYTQRNVSLTDDQQRIYTELKEYALAHIDDYEFMTAPNVMTQLLRMQQVLSGHVKSDGGEVIEVKDNRINELMDCLEEIDGKAIIWSRFRYDVKRITEALTKAHGPGSTVSYFGDTTDEERSSAIEQFQNGDARFFVGNPQTGGYGITLTAATTVIYFANSFDLAVRVQSEDRAHRIGQTDHVTYIDLISEGTIDERIVKALRNKMDIASTVLGEELKEWLR